MAKQHGKDTYISLNAKDISQYCNQSEFGRTAGSHDTTGYGAQAHAYGGGLLDGKFTCGGVYDTTALNSPRAVIEPLIGQTTALIRRPEGTGAGKPEDTCQVLITSYVETSPVADMVTWAMEAQVSGDVTSAAQV